MRKLWMPMFAVLAGLLAGGCRHTALRGDTLAMASTISDLQYRLVLDNLAMLGSDPDLLPWHVKLDDGIVQVEDEGRLALDISPLAADLDPLSAAFGERRQTQRWGLVPVTNPEELRDLQALYRQAMGREVEGDPIEEIENIPRGWFETGGARDVAVDAVYVGRWREHYAWVRPGRTRELTNFTLAVLSIVRLNPDERRFDRRVIPAGENND